MVSDIGVLVEADALSVTLTVKVDEVATVGVPEIVAPTTFNPAGSDPLATDHVYGGVPPVAFSG